MQITFKNFYKICAIKELINLFSNTYFPINYSLVMSELFEDIFSIQSVNKDGKPFDRVSRIFCESESFKMNLILDIHDASYPTRNGEKFRFTLLRNLLNDNYMETDDADEHLEFETEMDERTDDIEESNLRNCDYCMYGKVYKIIPSDTNQGVVYETYISFGGLLVMLKGDSVNFNGFKVGQHIFMKMKRIAY